MNKKLTIAKLATITPCPWNPRVIDTSAPALLELAKSIKESGQIQPGVARPTAQGYELLAGRRRFEACKLAGLDTMILITATLTDAEAKDVTVLENLQREQLTPIEEARGIQTLLDTGHRPAEIAGKMGKSAPWILRRAQLTKLIPALVARIESGVIRHLADMEALSRLSTQDQELFSKQPDTVFNGNVEKMIQTNRRKLKSASWDPADATLLPEAGACTDCAQRSSHQPGLFDDELDPDKIKADDTCLDARCFRKKFIAAAQRQYDKLTAQGKDIIKITTSDEDRNGALGTRAYKVCAKTDPGARLAANIDPESSQCGTVHYVTINADKPAPTKTKPKASSKSAKTPQKPAEPTLQERIEKLETRRHAHALLALNADVKSAQAPAASWFTMPRLMALVFRWGQCGSAVNTKVRHELTEPAAILQDKFAEAFSGDPLTNTDHPFRHIWKCLTTALAATVFVENPGSVTPQKLQWALACCEILGTDWNNYLTNAEKAIPPPKVLATLQAKLATADNQDKAGGHKHKNRGAKTQDKLLRKS